MSNFDFTLMAVAFVSINSLSQKKNVLTGNIPLEIDNAASTGIHGNYMKYGQLPFASSVSSTNTVLQRELMALEKLSLHPTFTDVRQILLFPSKCAEDDFRSKLNLL